MSELLRVTELSKRFSVGGLSQLHAVTRVSFHVDEGECLGLVGESGCGKSTLGRLVSRLLDLSEGGIEFMGQSIGQVKAKHFAGHPLRKCLQMIFQDPAESLNPRFTMAEAIADPLARLAGLSGQALRARVAEAAGMADLPAELLGRYPHQLSGGQLARAGIARAVSVRPRLLVLDEPTSALDVSVQAVVLKLLSRLKRELSLSMLFVSHDLHVVRLICDRVMVMYLGRVVEMAKASEIFTDPWHPYTAALAAAIPRPDRFTGASLPGEAQSPVDPDPSACPLVGRCPRQTPLCRIAMPVLRPFAPGRFVACHAPLCEDEEPSRT